MLIFIIYNSTLKARYDLHCVESAVKLQPTNQPRTRTPNLDSSAVDLDLDSTVMNSDSTNAGFVTSPPAPVQFGDACDVFLAAAAGWGPAGNSESDAEHGVERRWAGTALQWDQERPRTEAQPHHGRRPAADRPTQPANTHRWSVTVDHSWFDIVLWVTNNCQWTYISSCCLTLIELLSYSIFDFILSLFFRFWAVR